MPAAPDFPPSPDLAPVRRALLSVSDKTGLIEAAKALSDLGVELISTGGTRAAIAAAGLAVKDISELTGFPEMMDGRVKTLHPVVHGGLLGVRDAPSHAAAMSQHGIGQIDLIYVNLYPFSQTVAAGGGHDDVNLLPGTCATLAAAHAISRVVDLPVLCASGLSAVTLPMAIAAGASGVGVGSAVNRLGDELAMVAVVRSLREALGSGAAVSAQA